MVVVEEQDYYYSDSDSDDEDVDRYVFLARQPAPQGRHAEDDDRDASSANDDDDDGGGDDGTAGEEESEGGVRKTKKRPLREILGDDAPPPTKKARLELIIASPLAAQTAPSGSESNLASSPRAGESGSEGSHEKAHEHRAPTPRKQGEAKNATKKKRGACGKRSRSPDGEADGDRDDVAAAAAKTAGASSGATATSGRFPCSLCDRCFDSHQALGGHVLGHRKRTKIAIATGAILDADDAGEESAAVEAIEEAAKSIAQADGKELVAARRGKANGDDSSDEGKTVDDAAERGDEDVDRARHNRQRKVHGKGNSGVGEPVFAGSHDDANGDGGFDNKCNPIGVSAHGFTNGGSRTDGKMDIGTASSNRKVGGAGTCHEGANGNGNVCRTRYKCKVCGTECLTGRALGGHMRKHWKRPPAGGGGGVGEERSPSPATDDDCQIPLAQLFGAETCLQREI
jgi:hypothetical protein